MTTARIDLARLPTPLERADGLTDRWGGPTIWVKRDDLTGFELSGNKVRKLEYHLAAARDAGARTVITCGAEQSNHCRATALAAARLGLGCRLLIRTRGAATPDRISGNHRLQYLAGAEVRYVSGRDYAAHRVEMMQAMAVEVGAAGSQAWVIPEGASDWLGMLGMADAFEELEHQLAQVGVEPATVWHASSSGGTTAGFIWGRGRAGTSTPITAVSVGEATTDLRVRVDTILSDAAANVGQVDTAEVEYRDDYIGGGYGIIDADQPAEVEAATAASGLLFDPTYTGKALFALASEIRQGRFGTDDHVVFWHTGGGFAALI